ncbi:hypothetical protein GCM10023188_02640 [Pontibacter saemangeumensis]|uniref:DUF2490 domain-containing protein n=2 Tax=Pontibacter saemangeumensis TaxID=1084525 RepID=A0ABP8L694_9BACT
MIGLLFASPLFAQSLGKQVTKQQLVTYTYNNTLAFRPKWALTTEIQERRFRNPDEQHQFQISSRLYYSLGKSWGASVGFAYLLQSPQDPHATDDLVVPELRPYVQFDYRQRIGRLSIGHRYMIEKRFFRNTAYGELAKGYNTNYRFRYRLGLEYHIANINNLPLQVKASEEIHVNAGKSILYNRFNQNRIYVGLNYALHKNINIEAGYLYWFQQRVTGNQFFSRDIISLMIFHKINLNKKEDADPADIKK